MSGTSIVLHSQVRTGVEGVDNNTLACGIRSLKTPKHFRKWLILSPGPTLWEGKGFVTSNINMLLYNATLELKRKICTSFYQNIPLNPAVPEQLWHHSQKAPDNQSCIVEGSCLGCGPYPIFPEVAIYQLMED